MQDMINEFYAKYGKDKVMEAMGNAIEQHEYKPKETEMIKYEKVTDLTLNEIAKAMIDGEVFYSDDGMAEFTWSGNEFRSTNMKSIPIRGDYYRKFNLSPMEAAKKACAEKLKQYNQVEIDSSFDEFLWDSDNERWDGEYIEMCRAIVNAYDGK